MKVLQVNCVYKKGSTGKITADLHYGLLAEGVESVVCYGRGQRVSEPGVYKTCPEWYSKLNNALTRITGLMYGGCFFSTSRLISIIKREKPDIVHLQCINGYFVNIYRLITWLKEHHIKTVLTLHAEFMYTANCGHALDCDRWKTGCGSCPRCKAETKSLFWDGTARSWTRMKKAFEGFDSLVVTSVSPWLMDRAKQSPILADKTHCVILNGLDTTVFHPCDTSALRRQYDQGNRKIIFHATAGFSTDPEHIKGGWYLCQLAKRLPEALFLVAGPYEKDAAVPENVILLGRIADQQLLAQYYAMADVTVITSKKETFSMVVAESLCCGTPVVGFQAGGPEQISIAEFSRFVKYGDIEQLQSEITAIQELKSESAISEISVRVYSTSKMLHDFRNVYMQKPMDNAGA